MDDNGVLQLERDGVWWRLVCEGDPGLVRDANAYLGYLADRNFSPRTVRTYGYGLLAYHRWLHGRGQTVREVVTDDLLAFVAACRQETVPGRPGPNVVDLAGRRTDRLAPASVNLRLAAVAGLYEFLTMREPVLRSPVPRGKTSSWFAPGERAGMLAHTRCDRRRGRGYGSARRGARPGRWMSRRRPRWSGRCAPAGTWPWRG